MYQPHCALSLHTWEILHLNRDLRSGQYLTYIKILKTRNAIVYKIKVNKSVSVSCAYSPHYGLDFQIISNSKFIFYFTIFTIYTAFKSSFNPSITAEKTSVIQVLQTNINWQILGDEMSENSFHFCATNTSSGVSSTFSPSYKVRSQN